MISIHALREESDFLLFLQAPSVRHFNPRSPRGERHIGIPNVSIQKRISIHALREESDRVVDADFKDKSANFNPRSPRGERHVSCILFDEFQSISIHALREESDPHFLLIFLWDIDFNPRSPRGERRHFLRNYPRFFGFQSTLSARRATRAVASFVRVEQTISIHALREESDIDIQEHCSVIIGISIHALREESDQPLPVLSHQW